MIKCPKCGANSWWIGEHVLWTGTLNDRGELNVGKVKDPAVGVIECRSCGYELTDGEKDELVINWPDNPIENPEYTD